MMIADQARPALVRHARREVIEQFALTPSRTHFPQLCIWLLTLLMAVLPGRLRAEFSFSYVVDNGAITITGSRELYGLPIALVIPSMYVGCPVTAIAEDGFSMVSLATGENFYQLTSATLPGSITNIGARAFWRSPCLANVWIGNGVTSIGDRAFAECSNLTAIYFMGDAPSLGSDVFGSTPVTVYYLPGTTGWSSTFGGRPTVLWDLQHQFECATNHGAITITKYNGPGGAVEIPNALNALPVTTIGDSAFLGWAGLTSAVVPEGVTNIGSWAFSYCGLLDVTLPESLVELGEYAFANCASLTNVTLPKGLDRIAKGQFAWCERLAAVTIPTAVTSVGDQAFYRCTGLIHIAIPASVTSIGDQAFSECLILTNLVFPSGVTNIGRRALALCYDLTHIAIPGSVVRIGDGAFSYCLALTGITVDPTNSSYSSLDGVLFNKNQTVLLQFPIARTGPYSIPRTVTRIGDLAFAACYGLTGIDIPDTVAEIGQEAFYCTGLTTANIPDRVSTIGSAAFRSNPDLANVTIGKAVKDIADNAFDGCGALDAVYFQGDSPHLGSGVFDYDNRATIYYLPGTIGWSSTFGGRPTAWWLLPNPVILDFGPRFGVQGNAFGFVVSWATNASVAVEANTNLSAAAWCAIGTNSLKDGWSCFSDPAWTNHARTVYRVRSL